MKTNQIIGALRLLLIFLCIFSSSCKKDRSRLYAGLDRQQVEGFFKDAKSKSVYLSGEGQSYTLDWSNATVKKVDGADFLQFKVSQETELVFSNFGNKISGYYNKQQKFVDKTSGKQIDFVVSINLSDDKEYIATYYNNKRLVFLPLAFVQKKMQNELLPDVSVAPNNFKQNEVKIKGQLIMASFWQHLKCWATFSVWRENGSDGPSCYTLDLQGIWDAIKAFMSSDEVTTSSIAPPDDGALQNILNWGSATGIPDYSPPGYVDYTGYQTPDGPGTVDPNNGTTIGEIAGGYVPPYILELNALLSLSQSSQQFMVANPQVAKIILDKVGETGGNTSENRVFAAWSEAYLRANPSVTPEIFANRYGGVVVNDGGEFDAEYWAGSNLNFPTQTLPSYNTFSANYPTNKSDSPYPTYTSLLTALGGEIGHLLDPGKVVNTCAIRVSYALLKSNINIPNIPARTDALGKIHPAQTMKDKDGNNYFVRAAELDAWMRNTFGTNDGDPKTPHNPNHQKITKTAAGPLGVNLTILLNNKKGIYILVSERQGWASGHADLLLPNATCGVDCHFDGPIKWIDTWILQ